MELRHLRYFVAVAEELHFGRAAKKLHICQQPLSQQIRNLEKELQVQLFNRTKRTVRLTSAGAVFLEEARKILKQTKQAVESAQNASRGQTGFLSVGFNTLALGSVLPKIVPQFRNSYPNINLSLNELQNQDLLEALLSDRIDVAFLHPPVRNKNIAIETIHSENYALVLPKTHRLLTAYPAPISLRSLAKESFIFLERSLDPKFYDLLIHTCHEAGFSPRIVQEATSQQTIVALVAMQIGVAFLPESLQVLGGSGAIYNRAIEPTPEVKIAIAWRLNDKRPILQSFVELVKKLYSL